MIYFDKVSNSPKALYLYIYIKKLNSRIWLICCEKQKVFPAPLTRSRSGLLWWRAVLLPHVKSDVESSGEEPEAPLGWVQDTSLWPAWGDAGLSTPPPGRVKKWCQWHPGRESDVAANLIRQQVPDVCLGHLIIHDNKRKQRVWNDGMRNENSKPWLQFPALFVTSYLSLKLRHPQGQICFFLYFPLLHFYLLAPRLQTVLFF